MTDSTSETTDTAQSDEDAVDVTAETTDTLVVKFDLDTFHADIADQMRDAGVDPADDIVKPRVTPAVEQVLYEARQDAKHSQ
jgi:sugar phosphate isomerase/epimerase